MGRAAGPVHVPTQPSPRPTTCLVPLSDMERMRAGAAQAQWVLVEDAGHAGLVEAGSEIADAVRAFRQRCGVGPASRCIRTEGGHSALGGRA